MLEPGKVWDAIRINASRGGDWPASAENERLPGTVAGFYTDVFRDILNKWMGHNLRSSKADLEFVRGIRIRFLDFLYGHVKSCNDLTCGEAVSAMRFLDETYAKDLLFEWLLAEGVEYGSDES